MTRVDHGLRLPATEADRHAQGDELPSGGQPRVCEHALPARLTKALPYPRDKEVHRQEAYGPTNRKPTRHRNPSTETNTAPIIWSQAGLGAVGIPVAQHFDVRREPR